MGGWRVWSAISQPMMDQCFLVILHVQKYAEKKTTLIGTKKVSDVSTICLLSVMLATNDSTVRQL